MSKFGNRIVVTTIVGATLIGGCTASAPNRSNARAVKVSSHQTVPSARLSRSTAPPRVLLLGDSVMDQQGSAAAFLLRQIGIDARAQGIWGSGLLTRDQNDYGRTVYAPPPANGAYDWLVEGRKAVEKMRPDLVVVYLNHNYWPPYPRDAQGRDIDDLRSVAAQQMIATQARAFITVLRSTGARIAFVTPIPGATADPSADNPIWQAYRPVLRAEHIDVIDVRRPLVGADGTRAETAADCTGAQSRIRPANDLHLTRFGAGRTATILATRIAAMFGRTTNGDAAPGDHTAALVPTASGNGYWLIGCDGSIYHFGDAPPLHGVPTAPSEPVVGAARAAKGGLWLVTRAGRILSTGGAPALLFSEKPDGPVVASSSTPDQSGIVAVTSAGQVLVAGDARNKGEAVRLDSPVVGIAMRPQGDAYWIVTDARTVIAFGGARTYGSTRPNAGPKIVSIAADPTGQGYVLATADGSVVAIDGGRARTLLGRTPSSKGRPAAPTVGIVARGRAGYWELNDNGAVRTIGSAPTLGGTNNLALFTP